MNPGLTKGIVCFALMSSVAVAPVGATLIDRGFFDTDGLPGGDTVRLIYDDDLNITWLGDANFAQTSGFDADGRMNWTTANPWAASLTVGGFTDWRLPTTAVPGPDCGSIPAGYGCTGSEMGHLFYNELGGTAYSSILTSGDPDLALFSNIQTAQFYWSGTEYAPSPSSAWAFRFSDGLQNAGTKSSLQLFAWAVRSGDVATTTPEPSTMILLGSGLVGLIGYRMKKTQT